jgi:hypothetical protein
MKLRSLHYGVVVTKRSSQCSQLTWAWTPGGPSSAPSVTQRQACCDYVRPAEPGGQGGTRCSWCEEGGASSQPQAVGRRRHCGSAVRCADGLSGDRSAVEGLESAGGLVHEPGTRLANHNTEARGIWQLGNHCFRKPQFDGAVGRTLRVAHPESGPKRASDASGDAPAATTGSPAGDLLDRVRYVPAERALVLG